MTGPDIGAASGAGGRVGSKVAGIVAAATVDTRRRMAPYQAGVAQKVLADFTNHVSDEIRSVMGPVFRAAALDPSTPPDLARLFEKLGSERGQAWAWIAGTGVGAAMGGGLLNLLTNALNPAILPLIRAAPHGILDAGTAASVARSHLGRGFSPLDDSRSNGIDDDRFRALVELGRPLPSVDELRVMLNRGQTTGADVGEALTRLGYADKWVGDLIDLRFADHTGPDIAAMWNRGIVTTGQATALGRRVGLSETQMGRLLELGGEPPANDELLFAWRRGIITERQVDRALIQGPLRREWIDVVKALQWAPLPVAEAADAVNQGHLSMGEARKIARENGVKDDDFQVIVDNAGIPPGPQEALDWVNRGLISEAQFRTAFLESRIKNKYIDLYLRSRHEVMPPETTRLMYARGAMTAKDALSRLQQRGYSAEDAAIILDGASSEKTQASRDLTVAQVRDLYVDRLIGRESALAMLGAMGYEADEAVWILELADLARTRRFVTAVTNRIKAGYVKGLLTESEANGALDRLGVPAEFKDDALYLWDLERQTVTRDLTPAQIVAAVKKNFLGAEAGMSRLVGQGYDPSDAMVLLQIGGAVQS